MYTSIVVPMFMTPTHVIFIFAPPPPHPRNNFMMRSALKWSASVWYIFFSQNNLAVFQGEFGTEVNEMVEEKTVCQILSSGEEKITPIKTGCVVLRPQDINMGMGG